MFRKWQYIFIMCLLPYAAHADMDDCLPYKLSPNVYLDTPAWTKQVVQPLKHMDLLHGNVIATMEDNYDITADITSIEDGFCVAIKTVNASVGYSDFLVQIDLRHSPDTCSYNAILTHEDEHIRAYLSVIDDFSGELQSAIYSAADSVAPVFVKNSSEIDAAVDKLNTKLQSHPDLILIKQKIKAAEEIRNKRVDLNDTGEALRRCFNN